MHQNDIGCSSVLLRAQAGKIPWLGRPLNTRHHMRILDVLCVCVCGQVGELYNVKNFPGCEESKLEESKLRKLPWE